MEKIKETIAKYQTTYDEYSKISRAIRQDAGQLIRELIEKNGGEINCHDTQLLEGIYVSYDGGNHPEYASCIACDVLRIYLKDDQIFLDLEDEPEYGLDRVPTQEVVWMCNDLIINLKTKENGAE